MSNVNYLECPVCSGYLSTSHRFPYIHICDECLAGISVNKHVIDTSDYNERPDLSVRYVDSEAKGTIYCRELLTHFMKLTRKRGGELLDVGCSIGTLVAEANILGFTASGVDLDSNAIEIGIQLGRPVSHKDLNSFPDSSFDVIVLQHTLEHVSAPQQFIAALRDKLKADGYLLISIPNYRCLLVSVLGGRWYGWQLNQHYLHYSPKAIAVLFEKANLKVVNVSTNPMDHRTTISTFLSLPAKQKVLTIVTNLLVTIAQFFGNGDQIYAIAQK
jgi:2-polyprenyl-3-methyl-5-hydroxy-6-metoxy-1,4-benzoquinol methylase